MVDTPRKNILIVDDDPFLTEMYTLSLTRSNVHIDVVHDGKQAIAFVEKQQPDLMLLDLLMPVMDGFHVLAELEKKATTFPVIVLSNIAEKKDQDRCIKLGAVDFFSKGETDLEKLRLKVEKYL